MTRRWRSLAWPGAVGLGAWLVHELAARAMIDYGVAGALLAGGGSFGTVVAAAGFLGFRLACFVALAAVPAVLVWRASGRRRGSV